MGNCADSLCANKKRVGSSTLVCLICGFRINLRENKSFNVCANAHHLCTKCQQTILVLQVLKRTCYLECPFCNIADRKMISLQEFVKAHPKMINLLINIEKALNSLPEISKELFIFSKVYLHELHKVITDGAQIQNIDALRLRGRLLPEYSPFPMSIFNCLPSLRRLSLKNTGISSINTKDYTKSRLQLLNLNNNSFSSMKELIVDNLHVFRFLRQLDLRKNCIQNITSCQKLEFLKCLDLSCNQIKSMEGLDNLPELTDLNLEFNQITEFRYLRGFSQLRSLCLFGNPLSADQWRGFAELRWDQLRLLTVSVKSTQTEDEVQILSELRHTKWKYMQLIIFQLPASEDENFKQFEKSEFLFERLTVLKVSRQTYEYHSDRINGALAKILLKVRHYNRMGTNINFRVGPVTNPNYKIDENTFKMTKITNDNSPMNYLYHRKILDLKRQERMFFEFETPASEIIVGLYFLDSTNEYLEHRLQNSVSLSFIKEEQMKRSMSFEKGVNRCICIAHFEEKQENLTIIVNGSKKIERDLVGVSKRLQFFIHLPQIDDELKFIRYECE